MILNVKEASTKFCAKSIEASRHCIGDKCMAWRWFDSFTDDGTECHHKPTVMAPRIPEPTKGRPLEERRGFCGLAGKY